MKVRERFLEANIPYDDIDSEMIDIIDILNFQVGLKTEFCCYGHKNGESTQVVFDNCVRDEDIYSLANFLLKSKREVTTNGMYFGNNFGEFRKCVSHYDEEKLDIKWEYVLPKIYIDTDVSIYENTKKLFMEKFIADLLDYKEFKDKKCNKTGI